MSQPASTPTRGSAIVARLSNLASIDAGRSVVADLLGVVRRRKKVIGLVLLATILGTFATLAYLTEQYEAEARLLVMLGRENVETPVAVNSGSVFTSGVQEEEVNSYIQLLESRVLAEEVVDTIGPEKFKFEAPPPKTAFQWVKYQVKAAVRVVKNLADDTLITLDLKKRLSDRDSTVKLVQQSLKVTREGRSNVIHLALRLPSAELAKETLDVLVSDYFKHHIALRNRPHMVEIFDSQAGQYRKDLEALQQERTKLREQWGMSAVEVQRSEMLRRLNELKASLDEQRSTLELRKGQRDSLTAAMGAMPENIVSSEVSEPNPIADRLRTSLNDARAQRVLLLSKFTEDSPAIQSVDEQIAGYEDLIRASNERRPGLATSTPNPARQAFAQRVLELDAELKGLEGQITEKTTQTQTIEADLQRLNKGEEILHLLDLDRNVLEQKFLYTSTKREEARTEETLNEQRVANVAVLSAPSTSPEPAAPKKLTIMGVALGAGLLLGLGLALLLEWSDDTIYDSSGVSRPGDPPFLGEFSLG